MRARHGKIILLFFMMVTVVLVAGSSPVLAETCVAQLGYSNLSTTQYYYNSNVEINVPVSATCSYVGGGLYAVGDAYDLSTSTSLGSVSTALTAVSGGSTFNGQLVFSLPSSILEHSVKITVSIYGGNPYSYYYGSGGNISPSAMAAQMVRVHLSNYQNSYYPNPYQYGNCYQNSNYCNYPGYVPSSGYFNGNYYTTCPSIGYSSTVQCSGYLYEDPSGCIELALTVSSPYGLLSNQYYTLHNLPSSYTIGSWVTVTGQLYQGYNYASNGAACPGNYINVTSIS